MKYDTTAFESSAPSISRQISVLANDLVNQQGHAVKDVVAAFVCFGVTTMIAGYGLGEEVRAAIAVGASAGGAYGVDDLHKKGFVT